MFSLVEGAVGMKVPGVPALAVGGERKLQFIRAVRHHLAVMRKPVDSSPSAAAYARDDWSRDEAFRIVTVPHEHRRLKADRDYAS